MSIGHCAQVSQLLLKQLVAWFGMETVYEYQSLCYYYEPCQWFLEHLIQLLCCVFSVGGSQPIVFSYVSEFFTEKQRGPMIIILASCWQPGIIFTGSECRRHNLWWIYPIFVQRFWHGVWWVFKDLINLLVSTLEVFILWTGDFFSLSALSLHYYLLSHFQLCQKVQHTYCM